MAPIRLRHPKGVTTVDIDLASDTITVRDLQQIVFSHTEIAPSSQELKAGYPPHALTLVPDLPISSLGLQRGEQLVVTEARGSSTSHHRATTSASSTAGAIKPAPAPVAPQVLKQVASSSDAVETVRVDGGVLVHRVVPDDNSCLFSSIGIIFAQDMSAAQQLRQVVATEIRKNELTYDEAVLGQSRESYIAAMSKPSTWGGAIELAIFADHFQTEITSIDVESGRLDRFGESKYSNRAIVLYSGIHYDAVSLAPTSDAPTDFHETVFDVKNEVILQGAREMAAKLKAKKKFTNTATFDLKCEICGKGLKGEKEARQHAKDTGHSQFGEY
ncbi:OTU-domain-containing protein [Exidia glandulosa HHB12029]|uniref:Ubiquitin thioesterase OTU n=1 Tax=Exidia glandulosa HHB12029 TaxID=1314781 RepID=A0A165KXE4_EXIGL|nr:OTU-domain-containing protein [Exidia glandulosa HHB12029]